MDHTNGREDRIIRDNHKIFALLSHYLNNAPDFITSEEMDEITASGVSTEYAFKLLLASGFGLDVLDNPEDKALFNTYFNRMIHHLDPAEYADNPYYRNIRMPEIKIGSSELKYERYKPYEGFVCNDIVRTGEGRQIPQIGFFDTEFKFPAVLENGRIWMTITPNEIETMKEAVDQASGRVLTFGLGLGYYAYMASMKDNVESVTIVDSNQDVIHLFQKYILPQFEHAGKIQVIHSDAFNYADEHLSPGKFDFVFTDLWHDVSDGIELYLRMKTYERQAPGTVFSYWIEKSILCYI